jgi:alpha-1,6-mannosyltransferase
VIANLCHWANLGLVWWLTRRLRPGAEVLGLALYALNPLVVFEFAASGHNDGLMILFLLLSIGLLARGARWPALGALVLSIATKYTTLLLLPIVVWWLVRDQHGIRRLATAGGIAAGVGAAVAALYLPWWRGPETLGPIAYWLSTPLYAHYAPVVVANWLRDVVVAAGWLGFDDAEYLILGAERQLVRVGFVAYLAFEALRLRRIEDLPLASARALLVFLLAVNTWVLPWYYTWPLALVAVGDWRSRTGFAALGLTISAPLAMYWAQVHFDGMQPSGYVLYLAPLAGLVLWEAAKRLCFRGASVWVPRRPRVALGPPQDTQ